MTDITLNDMKFDCGGQQVIIPFDPPLKSLREARERVVQLDKDALQILGRSEYIIDNYIPPYVHVLHMMNFSACLMTYLMFSRSANFKSGSLAYDSLLYQFPGFVKFCLTIRPLLIGPVLGIHIIETVFMIRKLGRHGVTPFDGIWWAWAGSCFIEGKTSFLRADALIEEKKRLKEAKKH